MELFTVPTSPYARIVRVLLIEKGVPLSAVKHTEVTLRDPASTLLPHNPVGRVPTLRLDDGTILTETILIARYLDATLPGRLLFPGPADAKANAALGAALGFMEGVVAWLREARRPAELVSQSLLDLEKARAARTLDRFEKELPQTQEAAPDIGDVVRAVSLYTGQERVKLDWRAGRPRLKAWGEAMLARPSFVQTLPPAKS